jgi:hypothetical protein
MADAAIPLLHHEVNQFRSVEGNKARGRLSAKREAAQFNRKSALDDDDSCCFLGCVVMRRVRVSSRRIGIASCFVFRDT